MKKNNMINHEIHETFSYGVIYVYSIPDKAHKGRLKIGSATTHDGSGEAIEKAAHDRIKQQTQTADIKYKLEYCQILKLPNGSRVQTVDKPVHAVLKNSGYLRKTDNDNKNGEWFEINLETAKLAIKAVEEGRVALTTQEITKNQHVDFPWRPNQLDAIAKTNKAIRQGRKQYLWNAKMRFGKTSAAMQVAKENGFQKVLIATHFPSVKIDWYDDFKQVFAGTNVQYSSKEYGASLAHRLENGQPFVYFASLQDLRLSDVVVHDEKSTSQAKGFSKNQDIFDTQWDIVIVDEAHNGTQSDLGLLTLEKIKANFTLQLSGTPFNILHKLEEDEVYTWDYVMEQEEKYQWDAKHPGVPNPYAELPKISMFTYEIDKFINHDDLGAEFSDASDGAFKFHEFFRLNDEGNFVHESMIIKFLNLLVDDRQQTQFPYSTQTLRDFNKHSLWLLPNRVDIISAMEKLMKNHPVFGQFGIVNVSGNLTAHTEDGEEKQEKSAKERVVKAIAEKEYTITLTGERLTTGASIPEWTAVFMLSDINSATQYLQTAFRCQTPALIEGRLKTDAYIFDFAPDRTLKLVAEAADINRKPSEPTSREYLEKFINFCPIIAANGSQMKPFSVHEMLNQVKRAVIARVSKNGFDDPKLYNDKLLNLDSLAWEKFDELNSIVGKSVSQEKVNEIKVADNHMDDVQNEKADEASKKPKHELTEEEKELLKKRREQQEQKRTAISILRGVSIRMPMLVYGADVSLSENITLAKFIEIVDDESWEEFMPKGLTKEKFREFIQYYDEDIFRGVTHNIRAKAFDCDSLLPFERITQLAEVFGTFKNPDKETVLTPWRVVNMHLASTLGGNDFTHIDEELGLPEWVDAGEPTKIWSKTDARILEINSKSGLYPLLSAYNIYTKRLPEFIKARDTVEDMVFRELWNEILEQNIYVLCKSPMAKTITERTLRGYTEAKTNVVYIHNLVNKLKDDTIIVSDELKKEFKREDNEMIKFDAVVGNPPYQETIEGRGDQPPIYHLFLEEAYKLSDLVTMIHPARFLFNAGLTPKDWNNKMLHDKHLKVIYFEQNSAKVFPNTDIKGGVAITFRDTTQDFGEIGVFTSFQELSTILHKVEAKKEPTLDTEITGRGIYRLTDAALKDHPEVEDIQSKGHKTDVGSGALNILRDILFFEKKPADGNEYVQVVGLLGNRREFYWINKNYLSKPKNFDKYKIIVPKANGTGAIGEILSTPLIGEPLIGEPLIGYTETFIGIGAYDTETDAKAVLKYVKSKFARTMLGILKITQDNPRDKWSKVPLQDFTTKSDIDWSRSISEIDKQLYAKYDLNEDEINFIETHVKAMG